MNMPILNLIIQPILGAAAGYITNEYAINMLFKTYTPLKLGGVIPKTREAFIENVSTLVEEDIINKEKVEAILNNEAFTKNFDALIEDFFTKSIYDVTDNLSICDNPLIDKALSDSEEFINEQINLRLPELIDSLTKQLMLSDLVDDKQVNNIIEQLYIYLLKVLRNTNIGNKLVLNILNNNENLSFKDIIGYDASAIISQNISELLLKKFNNNSSTFNEIFEKSNISNLLFNFFEKFINDSESRLHDRILSIFNNITKSDEFNTALLEFSQKLLDYFKVLDIPLFNLVDRSCIDNFRSILYKESMYIANILISFASSNKSEFQKIIEEALNETIEEQDAAKKAVLSLAKGSILNSIAKNDISEIASKYFNDSNNRLNLCAIASSKLMEYLKSTTISQAINTLDKKEVLSAKSLSEFLSSYISSNADNIVKMIITYIKGQVTDKAFKNNIMLKLKNGFINKFVLSTKTTDYINNQLSIYLTKLFDTKLNELIQADSSNNESLSQDNVNFNDYIYNYLEQNKEKLIEAICSNINKATHEKSIDEILNDELSDEINTLSCSFACKKINETTKKISKKKTHDLYDKLNNIDDLHKNSSNMLKNGVINNLDSLLHRFVKGLSFKNLSQLDDDNLIEMAQSFIGKNLKPIMIFGAMLGLIAGFILAFIQPNNNVFAIVSISGIITCALVGYLTNAIAIAMLFRPYKEIKILKYIPFFRHFSLGYIAKNKENLAIGMSQTINDYLLTKESMNELIDTYKDGIKDNLIYNISKNNYEAVSNILMNNKDKIVSSISEYAKKELSNNKSSICNAISNKLENANLNDLLQNEFAEKLSQYTLKSKDYFNEQILKYLLEVSSSNTLHTISSVLPESMQSKINDLVINTTYKEYDGLIAKLNFENIKHFVESYNRKYDELIDKSISEFFDVKKIFSTDKEASDNLLKAINKALSSEEKIGEVFNKKISEITNNLLFNFFENTELNSKKLLIPMHPYISKIAKEKITSKLNFLTKISYSMVGGDKLIDSVLDKILSVKLPKLIANKKSYLYENCSNYLNSRLLNLSISEFEIVINSDITNNEFFNINDVISPAMKFVYNKMNCIKIRTLLEPLSINSIDAIFTSRSKEIYTLIDNLNSQLMANKNVILSVFTIFIEKYLNDIMKNNNISNILKDIKAEDYESISSNIIRILFEKSLVDRNVQDSLNCIKNIDKKLYMYELISKGEFIEIFEKLVDAMLEENNIPFITKVINDVYISVSENGLAFISNESKEYLLSTAIDAVILTLKNNLSTMLSDIEFDKIAKEQINEMSPKKIHKMFNSFAGKYFRTLEVYGFWGAVFGINTILGLALAFVYAIKNVFKKKVS